MSIKTSQNLQPDPSSLLEKLGISLPLIGFYDAPNPEPFKPYIQPEENACIFSHYQNWINGEMLLLTKDQFGCRGAGRWICGNQSFGGENFFEFLVEREGLRDSIELMKETMGNSKPYKQKNPYILIGPVKPEQWEHLLTVSFIANPDQVSGLIHGAYYFANTSDPTPNIIISGSGCRELYGFKDINVPQALLGATDIAMRQHLPPNAFLFTVTRSLFVRLCSLDEKSFLYKGFWKRLRKSRV